MWKLMTGMRRKPGTSFDAFRDYYETVHAPIAARVLEGAAMAYRRNYVMERSFIYPERTDKDQVAGTFDCIAEVWFETREALDALLLRMAEPHVRSVLVEDRRKFIDESSICYMVCEERALPGRSPRHPTPTFHT